jgi:hypothetical protein
MITIPDRVRKFPLSEISFLDMEVDDFFEQLITIKNSNCPNWTDNSVIDFGIQLLWLQAVQSFFLKAYMDRLASNLYIGTTKSRDSMRRLCELIDYSLQEAVNASVSVVFTMTPGHPGVTIPAKTKVTTSGTSGNDIVTFETSAETIVSAGVTPVTIPCTEGETIADEIVGSSDGTTDLAFKIQRTPVLWHSEVVSVYDGGAWITYSRVDNFANSGGADLHYRVTSDESQYYYIIFGDGVNGAIPTRGTNNIKVTYRRGGGSVGNVGPGAISLLATAVNYIDAVTNPAAASGGDDRESLDRARINAPGSIRTIDRAVTKSDFKYLMENFTSIQHGGIAVATAIEAGGSVIKAMFVPKAGGYPSTAFKAEVKAYLDDRKMMCTSIQVVDPIYQTINVVVALNILKNYSPSSIASLVRGKISSYVSPTYQNPDTRLYDRDFGDGVYLSNMYSQVKSVIGVDYGVISIPAANIAIPENKISVLGTLTITITSSLGEVSYYTF